MANSVDNPPALEDVSFSSAYGYIRFAYTTGSVSGGDDIGGLVGDFRGGAIRASYASRVVRDATSTWALATSMPT